MHLDPAKPSWTVDGRDWPNRDFSRFVTSGGLAWHVQEMGPKTQPLDAEEHDSATGRPCRVLLLHGTGAATHSFRDLAPLLARNFHVLAPDLPGHGFTEMPPSRSLTLNGMGALVRGLLDRAGFVPDIVVGHSAGAAILVSMVLEGLIAPRAIVSLNGALRPIRGAALFSPLAKLLFLNPLVPRLFARRAGDVDATRRLLGGTGSRIDARGIALYARLFQRPGHVAATLGMMANWDLYSLERRMPALAVPLILVTGAGDRAVPPGDADALARRVARARIVPFERGGHLLHEEIPGEIADLVARLAFES